MKLVPPHEDCPDARDHELSMMGHYYGLNRIGKQCWPNLEKSRELRGFGPVAQAYLHCVYLMQQGSQLPNAVRCPTS